ncbi:putative baseplate assembly protein [Burkholderia sp. KK1]|nr:putative baseplate assembly protein [Burkholderia sp. KK1]
MPLPKPTLDNRTYDQLVAEGRGQIPRLAPQWTDHNASDPGVTLIELAAWLAEQNIYRFDRLSDEAIRQFARLVGVTPLAPALAGTVVAIGNGNASGVALPARMQLHDAHGPLFETTEALDVTPARIVALGWADQSGSFASVSDADASLDAYFPLGPRPRARAGHAFLLGFDRALDAPDATLSLHVWTDHWQDDAGARRALIDEEAALAARLKLACPAEWAGRAGNWRLHYRARTVWEFHAGGGLWQPLQEVVDETRALSLTGFVRFAAPANHQAGALAAAPAAYFIRCRLSDGGYECAPRIVHAAVNAVSAEHALTRGERAIGMAAGHALARFAIGEAPVVADSVQLRLDDGAGTVETDWVTKLDWDASGPHDRHVLLVPEDGGLASGDGLRGQPLPAGFAVHASFRAGGGAAGNVDAATLAALPASPRNVALAPALGGLMTPLTVAQPFAAAGGAARETLDALRARAYTLATSVDKAVTLPDFERLALAAPALPVARAHAVANLSPWLPCYPAPGAVAVVIVPRCRLPAPRPSRALRERVAAYLAPRRLVTSEVHVIAPHYRRVGVQALLHLDAGIDLAATLQLAGDAINRFFDPLTGGPDGAGWPIGRTVYRSEVMALLAVLPGVTRVTDFGFLTLARRAGVRNAGSCGCGGDAPAGCGCSACGVSSTNSVKSGSNESAARCGNVELCAHELVRPGPHRLRAQAVLPVELQRSDPHECESAR